MGTSSMSKKLLESKHNSEPQSIRASSTLPSMLPLHLGVVQAYNGSSALLIHLAADTSKASFRSFSFTWSGGTLFTPNQCEIRSGEMDRSSFSLIGTTVSMTLSLMVITLASFLNSSQKGTVLVFVAVS